jgi:hypothetical protein
MGPHGRASIANGEQMSARAATITSAASNKVFLFASLRSALQQMQQCNENVDQSFASCWCPLHVREDQHIELFSAQLAHGLVARRMQPTPTIECPQTSFTFRIGA